MLSSNVSTSQLSRFAAELDTTFTSKLRKFFTLTIENFQSFDNRRTLAILEEKLSQPVIVRQAAILCEDYIYNRLHQKEENNYQRHKDGTNNDHLTGLRRPTDVSLEIQRLGAKMESTHPELYCNIARQLMMPLRSDVAVRKALVSIGDCMFQHGVVTWGRVVGLFAVTGAIAAECVEGGHSPLIRTLVTTFSELIDRYASKWIYRQGGWVRIVTAFRTVKEVRGMWALTVAGAMAGSFLTWLLRS